MYRINVTKTFLPPFEEYQHYLEQIWKNNLLTNQGPLLKELEVRLTGYLRVNNLHFVSNGTLALQLSLNALGIRDGEIITSPFSYVATTSAILWERCKPVYVDIEPDTFCIDASKIEEAITPQTKAIMPVHVFGNPCDIEKIENIARKHNLKVIYDAAHAFGVNYKDQSIFNYGDISVCSFHATKPFHTIEGGALVVRDKAISEKVELIKRFGHSYDDHIMLGINAKASEFQAAMGLCNLKYIDEIIRDRRRSTLLYDRLLSPKVRKQSRKTNYIYNYAYYPIVLESEKYVQQTIHQLNKKNIYPRRYFYPSLNTLEYIKFSQHCPISEDISARILCLPLYSGLNEKVINRICETVNASTS